MWRSPRILAGFVLALAIVGVLAIAGESSDARQRSDFTIEFSAGLLLREGHPSSAYDQTVLGATMTKVAPQGRIDPRLPFNLPLGAALPFVPLSLLPFDVAFRVWQLLLVIAMAGTVFALQRAVPLGSRAPVVAGLCVLAAVPTWAALTEGQPTPLLALGGALGIVALRQDRALIATLAGLLLAIKPQYLPAYLIVLIGARHWRSTLAAALGAAALLLSPLAAGGIDGMRAWLHSAFGANAVVGVRLTEAWIGSLASLIPSDWVTTVSLAIYIATLLGLLLLAWRGRYPGLALAALAGWVVVLASPHALPHDLLLLLIPGWLGFGLARSGFVPSPALGLLATNLALVVDQRSVGFVIAPIVMTVVVAWYALAFRQRAARPRRPQAARAA
jgi:hypothetical protein